MLALLVVMMVMCMMKACTEAPLLLRYSRSTVSCTILQIRAEINISILVKLHILYNEVVVRRPTLCSDLPITVCTGIPSTDFIVEGL